MEIKDIRDKNWMDGFPKGIMAALFQETQLDIYKVCSEAVVMMADRQMYEICQRQEIEVRFYGIGFKTQTYEEVVCKLKRLKNMVFSLECSDFIEKTDESYCVEEGIIFLIENNTKAFQKMIYALSKEVMDYTYAFLEKDTSYFYELTGYDGEKEELLSRNFSNLMREHFQEFPWERCLEVFHKRQIRPGVALSRRELYEAYLTDALYEQYWCFPKEEIGSIYVGNQDCLCLMPERKQLLNIYDKAVLNGHDVVFVFPPISQYEAKRFKNLIKELSLAFADKKEAFRRVRIVLNDWGSFYELSKNEIFCKQILLGNKCNKQRKDPRYEYKLGFHKATEDASLGKGLFDQKIFVNRMKELSLKGALYEDCGIELFVSEEFENHVSFPIYTTNSSLFCPTQAYYESKDRGKQHEKENCAYSCERYFGAYPSFLHCFFTECSIKAFFKELKKFDEEIERLMDKGFQHFVFNGCFLKNDAGE